MKRVLLTLLLLASVVATYAQRSIVTAKVLDKDTGESVIGAVVTVAPVKNPDKKQMLTSGYKGMFSIPSIAYGEYTLTVTFLGYNDYKSTFKVSAAKTNLGDILMTPGVEIETVVKEAKALRTSQHGDTVSYNAGAFKVVADADVEGLLKKMPGVTINNGTVEAQGEEVKKVFVDGKEFFGEDVTTAIKSLPAQAVDRIEVYNKLSDNAEFSGMDDGEGYKAINIVTHKHMRQGQFGKVYAGLGYDFDNSKEFKYLAGGNVNVFQNDSRISMIGLFNNVNQQNFSFEDILGVTGSTGRGGRGGRRGVGQYMVRPQSGVASVNAIGLNYSDTWGKRNQVTFQGSYFFNNTSTINNSTTDRWYEALEYQNADTLSNIGYSDTKSYNHRFNGRLEWKISKNQNLMIRPSFSYQTNDPFSRTNGWQYGDPEFGGSGYSRTDSRSDALRHGYNLRMYAVYRAKLGQKKGRTITIDGMGNYSDNTNNSTSWSNQLGFQPTRPDWNFTDPDALKGLSEEQISEKYAPYLNLRYLYSKAPSTSYTIRSNFTYTEPIAKYAQLSLQYRFSYENSERDKKSYVTGEDFSIAGINPDPQLSNAYRSTYLRHNIGPGFRWSQKRNTIVANVYYQRSTLDGMIAQMNTENIKRNYDNITYFMMVRWNFNRENSLRMYVSSYTDNPSVMDLQNVFDVSDAQNISRGNPNLNPAYSHRINLHYTNSNVEKGRTFMWHFSFQAIQDYNADHMLQKPGTMTIGSETYNPNYYSTSVNLDGYRTVRTHLSYGFPVGFLKSNLNLMAGITYTTIPSMIGGKWNDTTQLIEDGVRNDTRNLGYNARVILGSNISENVDFTIAWSGTYNDAVNAFKNESVSNRYFDHTASADMKFVLPLGFTISASAAYTQYIGFTNDYEDSYLLCNAWLGKKLFKNKRGEIMVGVNDIFNQNKGFTRSVESGYTQNIYNSVIGRYYMVQFVYNLRHFGKKGSRNMKDYGGMERSSSDAQHRRMMSVPRSSGFRGGFR